jgi:hypothetical protein
MSFVLEKLAGRPYFSYVPPLLQTQRQFKLIESDCRKLDALLSSKASVDTAGFDQACAGLESSATMSGDCAMQNKVQRSSIQTALSLLEQQKHISIKHILNAHAMLVEKKTSSIRKQAVWMDGSHPADAWYIAPPTRLVLPLLEDWCAWMNNKKHSVTLRGIVGLIRLLQIHPFDDANGRLSRVCFLGFMTQHFGRQACFAKFISELWAFRGLHLHRVSLELRDHENWQPYFEFALPILETNAA